MRVASCIGLMAALASCNSREAPVQQRPAQQLQQISSSVPSDWRVVAYAGGLNLRVPAEARVSRPQGIDSSILTVSGDGYRLSLDDYGTFGGQPNATLGGRPAIVSARGEGVCRERSVAVELPVQGNGFACDRSGKNCKPMAGVAKLFGRCVQGSGCATLAKIMGSVFFTAPKQQVVPPPDEGRWIEPPQPCSLPGDTSSSG